MDQEEREELQELYLLWDEAIHLYEAEEFPGDYDKLNVDVENWYTYRSILSERLELVMQLLAEKQFDFSQIEAAEVIEEDDDEKEDDEEDVDGHDGGSHDHEDEDDDYNDADVENQLRAKYHQSKMIPFQSPPVAQTLTRSKSKFDVLGRPPSSNGFEYSDVFETSGSAEVVESENDMLRFK